MNAKQRRTWYRALRPTMQAIVLHAKIANLGTYYGVREAMAVLGDFHDWTPGTLGLKHARGTPRWKHARFALLLQRTIGMVWNVKR